MTQNIFLSYRRDDSRGYTNAIYTLLELHFPADSIFMDVDTLVPGSDFVQSLEEAVENCDIFLAIIGSRWENIEDNKGIRRLENPEDFVRIEVAHALKRGIPVIPVLVDGAQMPFTENLPDNIKALARRHAFSIGDHMRSDVQRLIKVLEKTFERLEKERLEKKRKEAERLAQAQAAAEIKTRKKEEQKAKTQAAAELNAKEKAEKKARVKAEAERKAEEKDEAERIAREKVEADRIVQEKTEAERLAQEKVEADRIAKAEADAKQKAREQAEADQKAAELKAKKEADQKAKQQAEADLKAKKEAKQKARALAAAEKKEANENKRTSRQKTKTAAAQREEKAVSPSALKKIPVWVWPVAGVVLILIGYGIFGGFRPTSSEETRETGVSLAVSAITNTPTSEAISSTPTPGTTITSTAVPTPIPTAEPPGGAEIINLMDGAVMLYVPSGEFIMGSDSGETKESPAHTVYLDGFWIGKTEVTNDMYRLCVEDGACVINEWQDEYYNDDSYNDHPIVSLNWKQADYYCQWTGGHLPTEAEWEKAARGTDGRTYPWGEGADIKYAQYAGTDYYDPHPTKVGSYPEGISPYGLLDMAGNVAEYVADWYDAGYYSISPEENPLGPEEGLERVVRGGSFNSSEDNIQVTRRSSAFPREPQNGQVGFRCAHSATPQGAFFVGAERNYPKDSALWVYVPSGDFYMGSDSEPDSLDHTVYTDEFWIYRTEVTNDMYRLCVDTGACSIKEDPDYLYDDVYAVHPVTQITWMQADTYCRWAGGRLPTEAEWEKAARGSQALTYPWRDIIKESYANYNSGGTTPVGSYSAGASPYGLLDMAGNVAEWVADWYDPGYYAISPVENPAGPEDGLERVVRGGSWNSSGGFIRTYSRSFDLPTNLSDMYGFRCATSQLP